MSPSTDPTGEILASIRQWNVGPRDWPMWGGSNARVNTPEGHDIPDDWDVGEFDRKTGDLYLGDIGEHTREEIDFIPHRVGGLNFGWRCMEGSVCTGLSGCDCNGPTLTLPIHDYTWGPGPDGGRSAIGGYVYRGEAIPDLKGTYIFADHSFQSRQIWSFRYDGVSISGPSPWHTRSS